MIIINLTPHKVVYHHGDDGFHTTTFPSVGTVRLTETVKQVYVDNFSDVFETVKKSFGSPEISLEEPIDLEGHDCVVIVSRICKDSAKELTKKLRELLKAGSIVLVSPDTGPDSVVRDSDGRIIGVRRFEIL